MPLMSRLYVNNNSPMYDFNIPVLPSGIWVWDDTQIPTNKHYNVTSDLIFVSHLTINAVKDADTELPVICITFEVPHSENIFSEEYCLSKPIPHEKIREVLKDIMTLLVKCMREGSVLCLSTIPELLEHCTARV